MGKHEGSDESAPADAVDSTQDGHDQDGHDHDSHDNDGHSTETLTDESGSAQTGADGYPHEEQAVSTISEVLGLSLIHI